jgi:hypothetical protein
MEGVITGWDVLTHPIATIRCFGWHVFFRAIAPWQSKTFLSIVAGSGSSGAGNNTLTTTLERCINLELRAKRIYTALAIALADQGLVGAFFANLARQEQEHADLIELCRAAALRHGWHANLFSPWQDYMPALERDMDAAEESLRHIDSIDAALQLVVQLESSQINPVFSAALMATNAAFIKKLRPFRRAVEDHLSYVVERLPQLSPNLLQATRELRARFPQAWSEKR